LLVRIFSLSTYFFRTSNVTCPVVAKKYKGDQKTFFNRDLNAAINIVHVLTRDVGWGVCESPNPHEVLTKSQNETEKRASVKAE